MLDLYSDTVTRPTDAMRQAMASAVVGDDMMGEDPTVNQLESMVAGMLGKEAAVFACSGTQSNQMALRVHCVPGDELLINSTGHIGNYEGGAPAALSGITVRHIMSPDGFLDVDDLRDRLAPDDQHLCRTRLVCLENTANAGGGRVYPLEQMQRVAEWAWSNNLKMHLDGARLFNATTAGGYSPEDVGQCFDTVSICFSKGLGCPMGSILVGSHDDIREARRVRKIFGGALRQAGIIAAAAVHALENHVSRLGDDHRNARELAARLSTVEGIRISPADVESNLVFFEIDDDLGTSAQLGTALSEFDVRMCPFPGQRMRAVTHLDVTAADIPKAADAVRRAMAAGIREQTVPTGGPHSE
ncbi:MAG: aminotransferase class I/II-fold pyridoxal phosphate-dependent enzyme [Fuerstiella sp.]|nr:aminotransferase class I/II-fold pyridoxal phosphate-dependent enzyme [Fuerstiella sp.]